MSDWDARRSSFERGEMELLGFSFIAIGIVWVLLAYLWIKKRGMRRLH